jgi:flagellum-specific peptidoglycan hydrolase FlgJ
MYCTTPVCGTVTLPTKEVFDGTWVPCSAKWVKYPDWASCFADRKATLERRRTQHPNASAASGPHRCGPHSGGRAVLHAE